MAFDTSLRANSKPEMTWPATIKEVLLTGVLGGVLGIVAAFVVIPLIAASMGVDVAPQWVNDATMCGVLGFLWSEPLAMVAGRKSLRSTALSFLFNTSLLAVFIFWVFAAS